MILAVGFLTRLPVPQLADVRPAELASAARWFPLVGAMIGAILAVVVGVAGHANPWLGAIGGVVTWVWITGALHLDGLGDLADALGAAHRDPARMYAVLHDPHKGTFGVVAIVLAIAAKLVFLSLAAHQLASIVLVPIWARLGTVVWACMLPPLFAGHGERFAWQISRRTPALWCGLLLAVSYAISPSMAIAGPLAIGAWWWFLARRLGGMSGDCLGAGVELVEAMLLAVIAVRS